MLISPKRRIRSHVVHAENKCNWLIFSFHFLSKISYPINKFFSSNWSLNCSSICNSSENGSWIFFDCKNGIIEIVKWELNKLSKLSIYICFNSFFNWIENNKSEVKLHINYLFNWLICFGAWLIFSSSFFILCYFNRLMSYKTYFLNSSD